MEAANRDVVINRIVAQLQKENNSKKTIVIVGAGISNEAASLPLGKEFAISLKNSIVSSDNLLEQFNLKIEELKIKYNFDSDDFKTILFALNSVNSKLLIHKVCDNLSSPIIISPVYRYIASLLFNKNVKAILNFNFDEILDQEILSVCGSNHYCKIISDNDIDSELLKCFSIHSSNAYPLYLKPHGSISEPCTLRFQRNDFYRMEKKITFLLQTIFSDEPVDILVIGFRLKFHEFSTLLKKTLHRDSCIYIVDKSENILDKALLPYYHNYFVQIDNDFTLLDFAKTIDS